MQVLKHILRELHFSCWSHQEGCSLWLVSKQLFGELRLRKAAQGHFWAGGTANRSTSACSGCLVQAWCYPATARALRTIRGAQRRPSLNIRHKAHWKWLKLSRSDGRECLKGWWRALPLLRVPLKRDPWFQTWFRQANHQFQGCSKICTAPPWPRRFSLPISSDAWLCDPCPSPQALWHHLGCWPPAPPGTTVPPPAICSYQFFSRIPPLTAWIRV